MRKNIRRVVDKYYDVYKPDDYEPGMDNLNPKREVEFDLKYEEILSTIKGRIEKQYKLAGLEYGDEECNYGYIVEVVDLGYDWLVGISMDLEADYIEYYQLNDLVLAYSDSDQETEE
jgi:hypothetical protein